MNVIRFMLVSSVVKYPLERMRRIVKNPCDLFWVATPMKSRKYQTVAHLAFAACIGWSFAYPQK